MRILFDIGHPAHVHLFKNLIWNLERDGHETKITTRDKEIAPYLLDAYGFKYENTGKHHTTLIGKGCDMFLRDYKLFKIARKFRPDIIVSAGSITAAHVSALIRKPSVAFDDTEHSTEQYRLYAPFVSTVCTPSCFKKDLGPKQVRYNGYHELAYLHPNYFKPNPKVLDELGLTKNDKFFILRFVSWSASHDIGQKGFINKTEVIKNLEKHGTVFITSEGALIKELEKYRISIPPEKIHDLLYYATAYIGEGATMASEAAVLGVPSIYVNSLQLGYVSEESEKYGLVHIFSDPKNDQIQALKKALELLEEKNLKEK